MRLVSTLVTSVLANMIGLATPAIAQSSPWATKNEEGWFVATKTDSNGNKLIITCDPATQEQAAIMYMPKPPVLGSGQLDVTLGLDGTLVSAGAWQILQGGVVAKDYAAVVDLIEKISEAFVIDIHLANQPGASFDNLGFDEVGKGLARACGR